jgi:hypothetical protein
MKCLLVKNWRKHQSYEGRHPHWIKLKCELLNPIEQASYANLSDGAKLTLLHFWLLAAQTDNKTPEAWADRKRLNMKSPPRIDELISAGFLVSVMSDQLAVQTDKPLSLSLVSSSSGLDYEQVFSEIWADIRATCVPRPVKRARAFGYFQESVHSAEDVERFKRALAVYRRSERVAAGKVQDAPTWIGDWESWEESPEVVRPVVAPVDILREEVDKYRADHGSRPRDHAEEWDAAFRDHFGFTVEEWTSVGDEEQLAALAKRRAS